MSWLDGMVEDNEAASQDQRLERTAEGLQPGAFTGALSTIGPGLLRGGLEAGAAVESGFSSLWQTGLDTAASMLLPEPKFGGTPNVTSAEESSQETLGQGTAAEVMRLRPDPAEVGMVGQILGEAAAVLPRAVVGTVLAGPAGTAIAAGAPAGYSGKQVGIAEGLDPETATKKGLIDAATVGIGAALPAARFVKPLLGDLGIAVGANVGLGMAGRGATAALLDSNGYHAQAEQYKVMDGTALITDAVLGAAFFGLGRASMRRPTTAQVDAALTERTTQHADIDTAPGAPINPRSAMAHQDAIRTAIDQISRGEPVVLPDSIHSAQFIREDSAYAVGPARTEIMETAKAEAIPAIRKQLKKEIANDLPNAKDVSAELAQVQKQLDGLSETKNPRTFDTLPAEIIGRNEAIQQIQVLTTRKAALEKLMERADTAASARADLEAIGRGEVPGRFAPQVDAQADKVGQRFKPSPIADAVRNGEPQSMAQIARQEITRILDDIERAEPTLQAKPLDIPASKNVGKPETEPAAAGKPGGESGGMKVTTPDKPGADVESEAVKGGGEASDPVVQVADEILARVDDVRISTGAMDEDGNAITVSAKELMASADADIARAQQDSKGFAAAAACFLQRGF